MKFVTPDVELIKFEQIDVIATSTENEGDGSGDPETDDIAF